MPRSGRARGGLDTCRTLNSRISLARRRCSGWRLFTGIGQRRTWWAHDWVSDPMLPPLPAKVIACMSAASRVRLYFMTNQRLPEPISLSDVSEMLEVLESLFACGRELEALSRNELFGCRLSELVQIEGARREFAHFRQTFHLEISRLRKSLDAALALVERGRAGPSYFEVLQNDSGHHSPVWRLHAAPTQRRTRYKFKA